MRERADRLVDNDTRPIHNFLKLGSRSSSLQRCKKSLASNINRIQVRPQRVTARNTKFVRRRNRETFDSFRTVAGKTKSDLSAQRRQIIEANDGVLRKPFVQIIRET